ncbi:MULTISPECIES: hypothetical protein [Aeromonas]|uniref:hypothetical protein n=1 Tax=Aeromonas TaxID=642 RepID=UPI00259D45B8|nr:hypothetical protein [Aeromonas rivipollensis]MDM5125024.1 hypothetical protein [Aeromonas rivipollensis]
MDNGSFFALLRSFAQLSPMQLERAQEHLRDHLQRNLLHQALAEQQAVRPDCPHCHATRVHNCLHSPDGSGRTLT